MKKLLNIDGGGVRVYLSLLILQYIEDKTNKNILEIFDYFAGVSASSIILSGLLTKYTVRQMILLFKEIAQKIFYRSYYHMITSGFGIFDNKYSEDAINLELQLLLAGYKLQDTIKPLSILTYNLSSSKPKCFYSYDKPIKNTTDLDGYDLWKVVRASAAAPTYFTPMTIDMEHFIDGGVVTNNLSEMTFIDSLNYFGSDEKFCQISIGTGVYNPKYTYLPSGIWSWSGRIVDVFFDATSNYEMITLNKLSKFENLDFNRIDIELDREILLDDCNAFDKMDTIFSLWVECHQEYLNDIIQKLLAD